jgi:hypothetical protein
VFHDANVANASNRLRGAVHFEASVQSNAAHYVLRPNQARSESHSVG